MNGAYDFDIAVIGGGPGGSSAATALARRGHRVVVLERDRFPRFHIGESQLPTIYEALQDLGATELIDGAGFVQKWGASFMTSDGGTDQYADFSQAPEVARPQTYHVSREVFDDLLLQHAARSGATVLQEALAKDVVFDRDGVSLTYSIRGGQTQTIRVAAVVDASGRAGFIARRFGRRQMDPLLQNVSIHRQYTGVPRSAGRRAGDIRMVTRPDHGWFWFIPISDQVMSVGIVVPQPVYKERTRGSAEETLNEFLAETPAAARFMVDAKPVSEARIDADYSYIHSQQAGDRFVLVGDSGAFLDPIFSTGVLLAMQGGIEAANVLSECIHTGDFRAKRFRRYEREVVRRYRYFHRFSAGFYEPAFRDVFFNRTSRFGIYEAVLSVLAGNSKPSLGLRVRLWVFLAIVAIQRVIPLSPRRDVAKPSQAATA